MSSQNQTKFGQRSCSKRTSLCLPFPRGPCQAQNVGSQGRIWTEGAENGRNFSAPGVLDSISGARAAIGGPRRLSRRKTCLSRKVARRMLADRFKIQGKRAQGVLRVSALASSLDSSIASVLYFVSGHGVS